MMESRLNPRFFTALALAALLGITACDDDDNGITDPIDDPEPAAIELFDDEERVANEVNGTWQGEIPAIEVGQTLQLGVVVLDQEGDTIPVGTQFTVQAMLADEAPDDIVAVESEMDTVSMTGLAEGETQVQFQVFEGTQMVYQSQPITVTVVEADPEPVGARLVDRETGEVLAESEGEGEEMTWVGEVPAFGVGEAVAVNVEWVNAAGNPIPYGEGDTVEASFAEGADEDVLNIENLGDHVIFTGAEAGETQVIFTRVQNGTQQFGTQPISMTVTAEG